MTSSRSVGNMKIGDRIRAARENKGLSQEALADLAGLDLPELRSAELGTQGLGLELVVKVADALDADTATFIAGLNAADFDLERR